MIREQRTREKLRTYYQKFMTQGVMDPNIHPWVAEAWQRSRAAGVRPQSFGAFVRLTETERGERLAAEQTVIRHLDSLYNSIREFLSQNNISLLLLDRESYVLKSYTMSFYQKNPGELEGADRGGTDRPCLLQFCAQRGPAHDCFNVRQLHGGVERAPEQDAADESAHGQKAQAEVHAGPADDVPVTLDELDHDGLLSLTSCRALGRRGA